jgi:hypothetical protein
LLFSKFTIPISCGTKNPEIHMPQSIKILRYQNINTNIYSAFFLAVSNTQPVFLITRTETQKYVEAIITLFNISTDCPDNITESGREKEKHQRNLLHITLHSFTTAMYLNCNNYKMKTIKLHINGCKWYSYLF